MKYPGSSSLIPHPSSLSFILPRGRTLSIEKPPGVMGILNVTPDSFSDGGVHFDHAKAVHAALQMAEDGAAVIDIGGESTRPGAEPIAAQVEIDRVVPVIEQIRQRSDVPISIDTQKGSVAEEALKAGADMINDVSALRYSASMPSIAARAGVPVILMHMRGEPGTMQKNIQYADVVSEVGSELTAFRDAAVSAGVEASQILVDPAMGSLAAVAAAHRAGATLVRVHDVRETVDFLKVLMAIAEKER